MNHSETNVALMTEQEKRKFYEYLLTIRARIIADVHNEDSPLSLRERDILRALENGKTRTRIAKEFYISGDTVKSHVRRIYNKLNVHCKEDAIKLANDMKYI